MAYPVVLAGGRVCLRELAPRDVAAVHAVVGDPVVCETLIFPPKTADETAQYVSRAVREARRKPRRDYVLAVIRADTRDLVGTVWLGLGDYRSGNIGYAIRCDQWNRGYATEATTLCIRFGIDTLGLHRVWASHGPGNPSSGRVLLKAGMSYEGRLRHNVIDKGAWRDSLVYGIVADGSPLNR